MTDEERARLPVEDPLSIVGKRSSWLASLVPRRIALWDRVIDEIPDASERVENEW